MSKLIFDADCVRRIVEHSLSNGLPGDQITRDQNGGNFVAYAKGCNPTTDEDWYDAARALVGGDDFAETLPWAEALKPLVAAPKKTVTIYFGRNEISLEP